VSGKAVQAGPQVGAKGKVRPMEKQPTQPGKRPVVLT
jgi:hypothetical protein